MFISLWPQAPQGFTSSASPPVALDDMPKIGEVYRRMQKSRACKVSVLSDYRQYEPRLRSVLCLCLHQATSRSEAIECDERVNMVLSGKQRQVAVITE